MAMLSMLAEPRVLLSSGSGTYTCGHVQRTVFKGVTEGFYKVLIGCGLMGMRGVLQGRRGASWEECCLGAVGHH